MAFPFAAIAALGAGALGFAGQESTNAANAAEAAKNREFNADQAQLNREFQMEMSNTEIQRRIADLKAAGLNPALAYGQGGASAPSGSAASGTTAKFDSSAGAGINSASAVGNFIQSAATQSAQRQEIMARADLTKAQADNVRTLQAAQLMELENRGRLHWSSAARQDTERVNTADLFPFRARLLEAQRRGQEASISSSLQGIRESEARTSLFGPQKRLLEFQLPMAENMSKMADTWFGRNIFPYLNSAKGIKDLLPFMR